MVEGSRSERHKKKKLKHYRTKKFFTYFTAILLIIAIGFGGYLIYLAANIDNIALRGVGNNSAVYSRDNAPMGMISTQQGDYIELQDISPHFVNAVIAVEDNVFYRHVGINPLGIARALYTNIINRRVVQGGSTISQQLAKNVFLTHDRTLDRKLKELVYTFKLERTYSKDEILENYLNSIFYGHGIYGVGAATQFYFNKSPGELTLAESALLAGIIQGPHYYSPAVPRNLEPRIPEGVDPDETEGDITTSRTYRRRNFALQRMLQEGYITEDQLQEALAEPITPPVQQQSENPNIPAYLTTELIIIEEELGYERGQLLVGYNIFTTLDADAQLVAQQTVGNYENYIGDTQRGNPNIQAALFSVDPQTGGILAMAESGTSEYRITGGRIQPGSAFKPIAYALALESQKYTLINQHFCQNLQEAGILDYTGSDAGGGYHERNLTMREAMVRSCNIYAVLTNAHLGPRNVATLARNTGYEGDLSYDAQMVLGSSGTNLFDMARTYSVFANGGLRVEPYIVSEIQDRYGNTIFRRNPQANRRVISQETAFLITDTLRDALRSGSGTASTASGRIPNRDAAVKSGSTDDYAYIAGYTPEMVTVAYIGHENLTGGLGLYGGTSTSRLWADYTNTALNRIYGENVGETFSVPRGIEQLTLCRETLLLATPNCPDTFNEYFIRGTGPDTYCNIHDNVSRDVQMCTDSWKRATDFCPPGSVRTFRFPPNQQIPTEECDIHPQVRWPDQEEIEEDVDQNRFNWFWNRNRDPQNDVDEDNNLDEGTEEGLEEENNTGNNED